MPRVAPPFWDRVQKGEPDECWPWLGPLSPEGYGRHGHRAYAHRLSYEEMVGPIPEGLCIDHLCRNRRCVNPTHLEAVTMRENNLRGVSPAAIIAARDTCAHGHLYTPETTLIDPRGNRRCRECRRQSERATRDKRNRYKRELRQRKRQNKEV